MRTSALLATLTIVALAFAGCSGDGGGDGDSTTSSSSSSSQATTASGSSTSSSATGTTSSSGTSTGSTPTNEPPVGSISATVNGTEAVFELNGTDPDGDTLVWDLTFGDGSSANGTMLPATVPHTYAAGDFAANFTITDGTDPVTYDVAIAIAAGGAGGPGQSVAMAWDIGFTDQESATQGPSFLDCIAGPTETFNYDSFTLDAATPGLPFKATITDASDGAAISSWTVYFNLADCSDYAGTFSAEGAGEITGMIPENAGPFTLAMATGGFLIEVAYTSGSQVV